jgi:hypothetical protein
MIYLVDLEPPGDCALAKRKGIQSGAQDDELTHALCDCFGRRGLLQPHRRVPATRHRARDIWERSHRRRRDNQPDWQLFTVNNDYRVTGHRAYGNAIKIRHSSLK